MRGFNNSIGKIIETLKAQVSTLNSNYANLSANKVGFPNYSGEVIVLKNPTSEEQCVVNVTVDGWIVIRSTASYAHYMTLEVNSHTVWFGYAPSTLPAGNYFYTPMIPVKAGDIFTFKTNYNYELYVIFFPAIK